MAEPEKKNSRLDATYFRFQWLRLISLSSAFNKEYEYADVTRQKDLPASSSFPQVAFAKEARK